MSTQVLVDPTLYKVASQVRQRVKRWARNNPDILELDLTGGCAVASYALWVVLKARGIRARLVVCDEDWRGHCWVEVNRHVIDITGSQFGGPSIAYFPRDFPPKWFSNNIGSNRRTGKRAIRTIRQWAGQSPFEYHRPIERLVERLCRD